MMLLMDPPVMMHRYVPINCSPSHFAILPWQKNIMHQSLMQLLHHSTLPMVYAHSPLTIHGILGSQVSSSTLNCELCTREVSGPGSLAPIPMLFSKPEKTPMIYGTHR